MTAVVLLQLCYLWCADPPPPLSEHEAAVLTCFQAQHWVDAENIKLQRCLERAGCWHDDNGDIRCYDRPSTQSRLDHDGTRKKDRRP